MANQLKQLDDYQQLDRVFYALSDSTRRTVLTRLSSGPASVSELAKPFDMALPSFMQHLNVLEDCGMVHSFKKGRVRTYQIVPSAFKGAEHWLEKHRAYWEQRLDQLDTLLAEIKKEQEL